MPDDPVLGHFASTCIDNDQLKKVCLTTGLCVITPVFDHICLSVRSIRALPDCLAVDRRVVALEATLETVNEHISALESQVASKDA